MQSVSGTANKLYLGYLTYPVNNRENCLYANVIIALCNNYLQSVLSSIVKLSQPQDGGLQEWSSRSVVSSPSPEHLLFIYNDKVHLLGDSGAEYVQTRFHHNVNKAPSSLNHVW